MVWGSLLGALRGQQIARMSSKVNWKTGIEKSRFRGYQVAKEDPGLVSRWGEGGRRFGRKEENKKGRRKERKLGGKEDW